MRHASWLHVFMQTRRCFAEDGNWRQFAQPDSMLTAVQAHRQPVQTVSGLNREADAVDIDREIDDLFSMLNGLDSAIVAPSAIGNQHLRRAGDTVRYERAPSPLPAPVPEPPGLALLGEYFNTPPSTAIAAGQPRLTATSDSRQATADSFEAIEDFVFLSSMDLAPAAAAAFPAEPDTAPEMDPADDLRPESEVISRDEACAACRCERRFMAHVNEHTCEQFAASGDSSNHRSDAVPFQPISQPTFRVGIVAPLAIASPISAVDAVCMRARTHEHTSACTNACTHACMHTHMHACMHTCMHACTHARRWRPRRWCQPSSLPSK